MSLMAESGMRPCSTGNAQSSRYHAGISLPLMVLLILALQPAKNTMKYTIDDADYIINLT